MSSDALDLTSLAPPQTLTLTQPSSSHDLPAAPLPDSGVLPQGQNQDSGTLMDPDPNPNPKDGGVLSKDERFSVGNQDGVDIGIDDNDTRMSDQKEVCNPGDEDVPTDAGIGGVVEIAKNIGGMDENGGNQVNGMHMILSDANQDFKSIDVNLNVNLNEGGSMVVDVEASKEIAVEEVEVVGEASASLPCLVENNVAMEDENRVVDARVEREGFHYSEASKEIVVKEVEVVGEATASLPCAVENNVAMEDENRVVDARIEREGFDYLEASKESVVEEVEVVGEATASLPCAVENNVAMEDENRVVDARIEREGFDYLEASRESVVEEVEVVGEATTSLPCAVENNVAMEDENRVVDARIEREGFDYLEASKESVVEEVEVVGEATASLPCAVENNVAMEDENRAVDARVEREGFDYLRDQKLGGHVVESNVSVSDERGEKQIGGSGACENEVSVNVDKGTSLDGDGDNIAGSHVAGVGISVLGENRMVGTPAIDIDASLDPGEGKFVESCASKVGAAVLGESTPAGNFGASAVVDEQKTAGSDLSEMGLPKLCDNQIASNPFVESETTGEKNARSDITELGVSVVSNLQMMGSAAEHLETHLETDGKKLAEMNDPEGGISLLSENQMIGSQAVGSGVPLPMDENLNSEVKVEDISRPDDSDGNGSEGEEMETSGRDKGKETNEELTLKEENAENEVEAGYDGTLKTEDVAAVKLPVTEEKQNIGPMSPTTASIRNEYQASYFLPLEKKGQFSVSDLIWGKVRSHPWWPGQIFDPSDSSDLAIKYKKKGAFLVAYFGDQTFAWCEESQLKPFCTHFPRMEKQSTTEAFLNAANCALDEVSRRVQLGLTCSCTPEEVSARIKNQWIDNAGIREGASGAGGADMSLFEPVRLLEYIKELALLPLNGGERLELVIAKAQLMSFYSSKGYLELPAFHVHGGLVENDTDFSPGGELPKDTSEFVVPISISEDKTPTSLHSGEEKVKGRHRSSHKRNQISEDSLRHTRKQKSLAELMSGKKASNIVSGGKSSTDGKATGNSGTSPSGKKRKAIDSFPDDSLQKRIKRLSSLSDTDPEDPSAKKTFVVGDCICRVAGKLTGSPPILKFSGERFQNNAVKVDSERNRAVHVGGFSHSPKEKQKRKIGILKEYSSPDELLSQLCLAARDPMKGYSFLSAVVGFFTDFRNSIHLKHSSSGKKNGSGKTGRARSSNSKTSAVELSELDEMNDSYWTDRIIQGSPEEEPSQKGRKRKGEPQSESPRKRGRPRKQSSSLQSSSKLDSNLKQQVNEDMDGEEEFSKLEPKVNEDMNGESQLQRPKKRGRPRKQSNSLQSSPKLDSNLKQQVNEAMDGEEDCSPTALILFFNAADSVPSEADLSKIFSRYGPLKESDIMRKSNHAKVVFSKRSDAEVAFSSAGKFSIFGPALVSYQLKYLSSKPKACLRASRQGKEDETSAERSNLVSPQPGKDDTGQTRDGSEVPGDETSAERNNLVSPHPGKDDAGQTRDGSEVPGDETSAERNNLVSPQPENDDAGQTRVGSEVPGDETSAERNNLVFPQPGKDDAGQTRDDSEVPAQVETKNSISLNENIEAIS